MKLIHSIKKIVFVGVILTLPFTSLAQQDCALTLEDAQGLYDNGLFDSIPNLLKSCMNEGFTDDEKIRAYRLLILTYTFNDDLDGAKQTMEQFLDDFPEYELRPSDPVEFAHLHKTYETKPVFSLGIVGGLNFTDGYLKESFDMGGNSEEYLGDYSMLMSYHVGLYLNKFVTEKISIDMEILYANYSFKYTDNLKNFDDATYSSIDYTEKLSKISVPLSATYDYPFNNIVPFVRAGVIGSYIIDAKADITKSYTTGAQPDIKESGIPISTYRNDLDVSVFAGAGLKIKLKNSYIFADVRYNWGLLNTANGISRSPDYIDDERKYKFSYVDNDFSLNQFYISFGYAYSFYKTIKK